MPIYEYACGSCGAHMELLQKVGAAPPSECKDCGEPDTMSKKVSQTSFQLKGSGWYSDLYSSPPANEGAKSGNASNDSGDSKAEAKPEPKSESKPEPKTESKPSAKSE